MSCLLFGSITIQMMDFSYFLLKVFEN